MVGGRFPISDPEGGTPHPSSLVADLIAPAKQLRERLGHGIPGDLGIRCVQEEGSPHPGALFLEQGRYTSIQRIACRRFHDVIVHVSLQGALDVIGLTQVSDLPQPNQASHRGSGFL